MTTARERMISLLNLGIESYYLIRICMIISSFLLIEPKQQITVVDCLLYIFTLVNRKSATNLILREYRNKAAAASEDPTV